MEEILLVILNAIIGPAGGLVVLALLTAALLYGGWKLLDKWILPSIKEWFSDQRNHLEELMAEHREDRQVFKDSIEVLSRKLDTTDQKVDSLADKVDDLSKTIAKHDEIEEQLNA